MRAVLILFFSFSSTEIIWYSVGSEFHRAAALYIIEFLTLSFLGFTTRRFFLPCACDLVFRTLLSRLPSSPASHLACCRRCRTRLLLRGRSLSFSSWLSVLVRGGSPHTILIALFCRTLSLSSRLWLAAVNYFCFLPSTSKSFNSKIF